MPQIIQLINAEVRKKPVVVSVFELLRGITQSQGPNIINHFEVTLLVTNIFNNTDINVYLLDFLSDLNAALVESTDHRSKSFVFTVCEKLLMLLHSFLNHQHPPLAARQRRG